MYNEEQRKARNTLIAIGVGFVLLIIGAIVWSVYSNRDDTTRSDRVYIGNLENCSQHMQKEILDMMRTNMYQVIKRANDYNKKDTLPRYDAEIRKDSCTEKEIAAVSGSDKRATINESSAILDIPEAKQSWQILYHWVPDGKKADSDLGTVVNATCLPVSQLIYGDFNCEKIMSLQKYGTDKVDPILQYMPYTGAGFNLKFNPDTKEVTATIELRESEKDNQTLINSRRGQVVYWFSHRNLDITRYTVTYINEVESKQSFYGD